MDEYSVAGAARSFSQAADDLVQACRLLEQYGIPDEPVEGLLQALEQVTRHVHRMNPPPERLQTETADLAGPPPCHVAARSLD